MPFEPKDTRRKRKSIYKTVYIPQEMVDRVSEIAKKNATSFNNVVVSMIEKCLNEK